MWKGGGVTVGRVGGLEMTGETKPPPSARDRIYPGQNANYVHGSVCSSWQFYCSCGKLHTTHFAGDTTLH